MITEGSDTAILIEVQAERRRQIEVEGFSAAHDDLHDGGELAAAAASYALLFGAWAGGPNVLDMAADAVWPWKFDERRRRVDRRSLVIAAALLVAEIERVDRKSRSKTHGT